jgi:hypothetical protein
MDDAAGRTLAVIEAQQEVIRATADCVHRGGSSLWYFHDFTILDLQFGRVSARRTMLEARRRTVVEGGDHFVNLLDAFGAQAGVSWFNDYIHLSTLGHQRVAELICADISH